MLTLVLIITTDSKQKTGGVHENELHFYHPKMTHCLVSSYLSRLYGCADMEWCSHVVSRLGVPRSSSQIKQGPTPGCHTQSHNHT